MEKQAVIKMGYVIQEYLNSEKFTDVKPKDLMPIHIEKVFFENDHRNGLPLRNILRELNDNDVLYLLPQLSVERKERNRFWFFNKLK
jgi:hypothetical protein